MDDTSPQNDVEARVVEVLKTCYDPEIPVNIYELGLIYCIEVQEDNNVHINMTLTSPACPVAGTLPPEIQNKVAEMPEISDAKVDVVWDPPWTVDMMSEAAKLELGIL